MPRDSRRRIERLRWGLALLAVPLALFVPLWARGEVFLPLLPVAFPPLAEEYPGEALEAVRNANYVVGDRIFPFLSDQVAMREEWRRGCLPTWEPYLGLGMPLLGQTIAGSLYPPNFLILALSPEVATVPLAVLALILAGTGTWLFLRRLGLDRRAALVGVLAQQLGTWGIANLALPMKVDAALWFPWALWAVEGVVRQRRGSLLGLALFLGLSFLGGMVTIGAFVLGATLLYALVRLEPLPFHFAPRSRNRTALPALLATVCCVLGAGVAAVQLLPLAETGANSLRDPVSPAEVEAQGLPLGTLAGIVVPDIAGRPDEAIPGPDLPLVWWLTPAKDAAKAEHANVLEWNTHAGAVVFLLTLVAVVSSFKRSVFPAVLLAGVLGFAQGWPGLRWLYGVPGLNVGAPGRVLALAWTLWPWLAAIGCQALLDRAPRALWSFLTASFFLAASGFSLYSTLDPDGWATDLHQTLVARYHESKGITLADAEARIPPAVAQEAAEHLRESYFRMSAAALAAFLAGCLGLVGDRNRERFQHGIPLSLSVGGGLVALAAAIAPAWSASAPAGSRAQQAGLALGGFLFLLAVVPVSQLRLGALWVAALGGLLGEGFLGTHGHVSGRRVLTDTLFPPSETLASVGTAAGDGRVLRYDPHPDLSDSARLARPNLLEPYHIRDLTSYPTLTPATHAELWKAFDPRATFRNHVARLPDLEELSHPLLDLLRVQAILSVLPIHHDRLEPVLEREGFCVYRRSGALPPARVVPRAQVARTDDEVLTALTDPHFEPQDAAWIAPEDADVAAGVPPGETTDTRIQRVSWPMRNRVVVDVKDANGGWLVVHEQWAPGWHASIDGTEVPVVRADHVYRAVPLPSGRDVTVVFRYAPASLSRGALLTAGALLIAGLLDLVFLRSGRMSWL